MAKGKKLSLFDAYFQMCFGKKLIIDGKVYSYWDIRKGKSCSLSEFEKFIKRITSNSNDVQLSLFDN